MSLNTKPLSNAVVPNAISSFVSAPMNGVKNAANNVVHVANNVAHAANNVVNKANTMVNHVANQVMNNSYAKELIEPINDSLQQAFENDSHAALSIPLILIGGVVIIFFILFALFRDQILMGFHIAWETIKRWFRSADSDLPAPPSIMPPQPMDGHMDPSKINAMLPSKKEVFNVADNKYIYSDAEPLCKSFGAELATYDQVKEAWNKGADWCNYGWVKGQSAIYPTQQDTYDKLQNGPEDQRMACGVPGINGGYFDNPNMRFGVNCYGIKPSENDTDMRHIMDKQAGITPGALEYDRKVQDYKNHRNEIAINPFKDNIWSA